jgi:hypothetical protein
MNSEGETYVDAPPAEYTESYAYGTPPEEYAEWRHLYIDGPQADHFAEWCKSNA